MTGATGSGTTGSGTTGSGATGSGATGPDPTGLDPPAAEHHRPPGAPPPDAPPVHRALILGGGGMRVAWQAGVVRALLEEGLVFDHVDATSGGSFTAAMLLSGVDPAEMGERWRTLDVTAFASLLPLREYLRGPTSLRAVADADGIVDTVYPHLGVDVGRIRRATGMDGTFNVCDFEDKVCVPVPHTDIDVELLVAGVSLPTFLPAVEHRGRTWTDAVWIKQANLTEAVRRGATELWLVWCIGNTGRFGEGPLEQYVHTIEMSAAGALNLELEWIAERNRRAAAGQQPVRLHVIKPRHPLPLDPALFTGRITADTLVAMGYRDAHRYLAGRPPDGVGLDPGATRMVEPPPGVRWNEHLTGELHGDGGRRRVSVDLGVEVTDLERFRTEPGEPQELVGALRHPDWGRLPVADGRFAVVEAGRDTTELRYSGRLLAGGRWLRLAGVRQLRDDPGPDAWADVTTMRVELRDDADGTPVASGELRAGAGDVRRTVRSMEPTGAHGLSDRTGVLAAVGRMVLGGAWSRYA